MAALFFPYYGFIPQCFPGKVFNEAAWNTYTEMMYSFFLRYGFVPQGFPSKVFNETSYMVDSQGEVLRKVNKSGYPPILHPTTNYPNKCGY